MTKKKIQELKNKIDKIKNEQSNSTEIKHSSSPAFIDVASELVAGVIVGVMMGLLLDDVFNTKPLFLVMCIIFAMIVAFRSIWKKYITKVSELK